MRFLLYLAIIIRARNFYRLAIKIESKSRSTPRSHLRSDPNGSLPGVFPDSFSFIYVILGNSSDPGVLLDTSSVASVNRVLTHGKHIKVMKKVMAFQKFKRVRTLIPCFLEFS